MEINNIEPLMLRASQACKLIGVSERTLQNLRASGRLPLPVRLNGCVLWKIADLKLWSQWNCCTTDKFIQLKKDCQDER